MSNENVPLGTGLSDLFNRVAMAWLSKRKARKALQNIILRMAEIDGRISKSAYHGGDGSQDRPPEGDDYNLLFDAVLDEIAAALK